MALEDPPSLVELRTLTERMLPQVDLPELLLEVNAWTGFADAFTHVSETRSRIPDLPTSVGAADQTELLSCRDLDTGQRRSCGLPDTIPLAQHWAEASRLGRRASLRRTGPNPRYFGTGRGVTYYNFTSDQFTGFHAIVVPGTIRDSLYVLDGLLEHETSLEVQEIVTDTAAYSDLILGCSDCWGFSSAPGSQTSAARGSGVSIAARNTGR